MRASLLPALACTAVATGCLTTKQHDRPGVDLSPTDIAVTPASLDTNSTVTVSFAVANSGPHDAPPSTWVVKLDDQIMGSGTVAVAAHSAAAESASFPAFEAGSHTLQIVVDAGNVVAEDDEGNNTASVQLTIAPMPAAYDLRSGGRFEFSPNTPTTTDALLLWTMMNADTTGEGKTMQFVHWHLLCDGAYVGSGTIASIPPNGTVQQTYQLAGTFAGTAGAHHYTILLDPHHTINETDETNNTMELDAVVAPAFGG
jgi:hypothetical protein